MSSSWRKTRDLNQPKRITVTLAYLTLLLLLNGYLNHWGWPPFGLEGLWYYSAFAALLIGEYIVEPYFTTPAGALANSVALILAVTAVSGASAEVAAQTFVWGRAGLLIFGGAVLALSFIAAYLNRRGGKAATISEFATSIVGVIGRPKVVFGVLLLTSGFAAFADSAEKVAILYLTWFAIVAVDPIGGLVYWLPPSWRASSESIGNVESIEDPGIALIRLRSADLVRLGSVLLFDTEVRGVVVDITSSLSQPIARVAFDSAMPVRRNASIRVDRSSPLNLVGHVGRETSLDELVIHAAPAISQSPIEESHLLSVQIRDSECLYQVTGVSVTGETAERQTRDLFRVSARKLGVWNAKETSFDSIPWIPNPGHAVDLVEISEGADDPQFIGYVPGTPYGVRADVHQIVTHNTAILGILGIGKTYLAWELIERMLTEGIKVVALDITGKYSKHFPVHHSPDLEKSVQEHIASRIAPKYASYELEDGHAGNIREFEAEIHGVLDRFFESDGRLLILNPNGFAVSRIEGFPRGGEAERLFDLTMVEVTRMVSEKLLDLAQAADATEELEEGKARICLVMEEAHSLIPEWNSVAMEGEKTAVNGTARAILQGRKYGLGSLLITQRTANVTKSILNQCNTVFGLRNFDATGAGFLENYIGSAYAGLIATLKERHAIVFGRASSCNAPVVLKLNEAPIFEASFWEPQASQIPATKIEGLINIAEPSPAPDKGGF